MENNRFDSQGNYNGENNGFFKSLYDKFSSLSYNAKKVVVFIVLILVYILGIRSHMMVGITSSEYESVKSSLKNQINLLEEEKTAHTNTRQEYDAYVAKMQPYEAQQAADEKAAAEKAAAEADAARLAAEKAAAEAEAAKIAEEKAAAEQAAAEAAIKAKTLGIKQDDFYSRFNSIASSNGYPAFLGNITKVGGVTKYSTLNSDVSMDCMLEGEYVENLSIYVARTTSESMTDASYYIISALLALDSSFTTNSADTFLSKVLNGAKANIGSDYKLSKNGIDYTMNIDNSSVFLFITKNRG